MVFFIRPEWNEIHINGYAQGTTYHITYYTKGKPVTQQQQIDSLLRVIDGSLSIYDPQSLISRFNRSDRGLKMDAHLNAVLRKSLQVNHELTGFSILLSCP